MTTRPTTIVIDGKRYVWKDILQRRREQCTAMAEAQQLVLFDPVDDARPAKERTATSRFLEPSLFTLLEA